MKVFERSTNHRAAMELLAKESAAPIDQVQTLYEAELSRLEAEARIKSFVPVLVNRRVRAALRNFKH
jgi:hypothetical protein